MMNWIAKEMQFTYTMSVPPDKKYGLVNKSGEGNGMVGQVMRCVSDQKCKNQTTNYKRVTCSYGMYALFSTFFYSCS